MKAVAVATPMHLHGCSHKEIGTAMTFIDQQEEKRNKWIKIRCQFTKG
jgi:hypothetical protein